MKIRFLTLPVITLLLCLSSTNAKGGGRGGGSRGGGSRGGSWSSRSSSRSSSSGGYGSSSSSGGYGSSSSSVSRSSATYQVPLPPPSFPNFGSVPRTRIQPTAPKLEYPQKPPPAYLGGNTLPNIGKPPPYPQLPPYPGTIQAKPPPYDFNQARPPLSYARTNQAIPHQGPYNQQPNPFPNLPSPSIQNYPKYQYGNVPSHSYPQSPIGRNHPYPQQPGISYKPYPTNSYHQSSGIPVVGSPYVKPYKKKGLLGQLFSPGKSHKSSGYLGNSYKYKSHYKASHGISPAMYPIIPLMMKSHKPKLFSSFRPRFIFLPHYHYHGYHGHGHYGNYHSSHHYDMESEQYKGRCMKPLLPPNSDMSCNRTERGVKCATVCKPGFQFRDNVTSKENECWHIGGVWRPQKNFPGCIPTCQSECKNGGRCNQPNVCSCSPVYRGENCEHHILNCDIHKFAAIKSGEISWSCRHGRNETVCNVRCRKHSVLESLEPEHVKEMRCNLIGVWTKDELPDCDTNEAATTKGE